MPGGQIGVGRRQGLDIGLRLFQSGLELVPRQIGLPARAVGIGRKIRVESGGRGVNGFGSRLQIVVGERAELTFGSLNCGQGVGSRYGNGGLGGDISRRQANNYADRCRAGPA